MSQLGCMTPECTRLNTPPSYDEFLASYLLPNAPVIVGSSLVYSWLALKYWVVEDGSVDWQYLKNQYGAYEVTVADCSVRDFSDQRREQMFFRDVVSLWQQGSGQHLYVKDWHLSRALLHSPSPFPSSTTLNDALFYTTPDIFRDDWMNAYYSACTDDDFRFVYIGAAGTFTPLHRDVYTSYSWSTNVAGRKRWWLFPPDQTPLLLRAGGEAHLEVAYDVRTADAAEYPSLVRAMPIVVEQGPGETIFVPSGWYHQVENLTACVSINHNWCNAVNLPSLYAAMCDKVAEVEAALEDVRELLSRGRADPGAGVANASDGQDWRREWTSIVQDVVEKDAGWNWMTFWRMVRHALSLALNRPCTVNEILWPATPTELMPPIEFIKTRIRTCYRDFITRDECEQEYVAGLKDVLDGVRDLLEG